MEPLSSQLVVTLSTAQSKTPFLFTQPCSCVYTLVRLNCRSLGATLLLSLDHVGHDEEMSKQEQQRDNIVQVGIGDIAGVLSAAGVDQVDGLGVHHNELDHLTQSQSRLPPNLLGVQGDKVVGVHHSVNHTVQDNGQIHITIIADVQIQPIKLKEEVNKSSDGKLQTYQEYTSVVVDVKETQLLPSLLQNNEHSIQEIQDLGQVEDIQNESNRGTQVIEFVARNQCVASIVGTHTSLNAHVRAKHDLDHVVGKLERIQTTNRGQQRHDDLGHIRTNHINQHQLT